MVIYVGGGSGSGKSAFAESLVVNSGFTKRTYIATMRVWDAEGAKRVERHRELRRGKGFETAECPTGLGSLGLSGGAVLLEDLSNLFMNEFFGERGALERVKADLKTLSAGCGLLAIVGNDIFAADQRLEGEMEDFMEQLGELNAFAAAMADERWEVASGIPARRGEKLPPPPKGLKLVIGGFSQGKTAFAAGRYNCGRGVTDSYEGAARADVFTGLENWLRGEEDPLPALEKLMERNPNLTIVCCEVGCGIVPVDGEERAWRERVGRCCCWLAERSAEVCRVWCGIPTILKGEN
ncbi:MAG: bifunctional adenosylcobinamide kinase/adenosylcobinamide-phosphate guanylyltransferase [Candidatus Heteroscillospira sp.]|jgi:adenosylcobinamide kinase/adenosylcobinamide-phosphate guanylyltransferase